MSHGNAIGGNKLSIPVGTPRVRFIALALVGTIAGLGVGLNHEMDINSRAVDQMDIDDAKIDFVSTHPTTMRLSQVPLSLRSDFGLEHLAAPENNPTNADIQSGALGDLPVALPSIASLRLSKRANKAEAKNLSYVQLMEKTGVGLAGGIFTAAALSLIAGGRNKRSKPTRPSGQPTGPSPAPKV